ncbi:uncharacterized protein LOC110876760 [Helianthus annuus]|uniref:uncharacterized protein LOC110876760 n=1 Tax=Helianthus annuus TaxID=4232 RepID=UPI000B905EDE|nr:uncharacterized protein LOC110876760 [Helianthus annuus]
MNTRNQDVDNTLKNHDKAITEIQATLSALAKQQEEILKAVKDKPGQNSGGGASSGSSFSPDSADSRSNRLLRIGNVEFPKFSGEDVEGWIYRCEHFFAMDETPDEVKLRCAVVHLEGAALQWHRAYLRIRNATVAEIPWEEYVRSISTRFSNDMFEDPLEELASLNQTGTLLELNTAFDCLLNKVNLTESQAISLYLKALRLDIRGPVKMFKPRTLHEAYGLAKTQALNNENLEEKFDRGKGAVGNTKSSPNAKITPPTNVTKLPILPLPNRTPAASTKPTGGARRLTSGDEDEPAVDEPVPEDEEEEHQISIHALTGIPSYSTMRVQGTRGTRQLHILIDSGSTHNFLDSRVAKKLQCEVKDITPIKVGVADGEQLTCTQLCTNFRWTMQGNWYSTEVLLLELENYDMILGVQWLLPLQDILWNFQRMTMRFEVDGKQYELKGLQNNKMSVFSVEKMGELLQKQAKGGSLQLFSLQLTDSEDEKTYRSKVVCDPKQTHENPAWQALTRAFSEVFQMPKGLPPTRPFDHRITLKEGTEAISQRLTGTRRFKKTL